MLNRIGWQGPAGGVQVLQVVCHPVGEATSAVR